MKRKVVLSFSGGKDSCFALYKLKRMNIDIACLLTTVWKGNNKTVAHDKDTEKVKAQANQLNLPVHFLETDFNTYNEDFISQLHLLKDEYNLNGIAYGDIYIEGHRTWGEEAAKKATIDALYPLWTKQERALQMLKEFIQLGFKAKIIKLDNTRLPEEWIGRILDKNFIKDIATKDVCPMGEFGEYHTAVFDGPIFHYEFTSDKQSVR